MNDYTIGHTPCFSNEGPALTMLDIQVQERPKEGDAMTLADLNDLLLVTASKRHGQPFRGCC